MKVEVTSEELDVLVGHHVAAKRAAADRDDYMEAERCRQRALELARLAAGAVPEPHRSLTSAELESAKAAGDPAPPSSSLQKMAEAMRAAPVTEIDSGGQPVTVCGHAHPQAPHVTCTLAPHGDGVMHSANGGSLQWDMAR
jgi:hypothetical protein